jgi:alpha-L-fucosidase
MTTEDAIQTSYGQTIDDTSVQGPFQPNWTSLKNYKVPGWYTSGKFGIFIHWGVFSVPAFASEWYARRMYLKDTPEYRHHFRTYGSRKTFGYKDFIPDLTFEKFDPKAYATLFRDAGATFVVPVAEHHDGFAMYDSAMTDWTAVKMGPKRDLVGDLAKAVRAEGMELGVSTHRAENYWFFEGGRFADTDVRDDANRGLYGPAALGPEDHSHDLTDPRPSDEFLQEWLERTCELVDKYQPSIVWFDWWIQNLAFKPYLQKFAAFYYNRAAEWGREVAINYKYDAFEAGTAVFDVERGQVGDIRKDFWQTDTSVSLNSWSYIRDHEYRTAQSLIAMLADVVSKNGALLLNIGPKPDGTIPEEEQQLLREIGAWLAVNGAAIYDTRPWRVFGEGPVVVEEGAFTEKNQKDFTNKDIRYTSRDNSVYGIVLARPEGAVVFSQVTDKNIGKVGVLGSDAKLAWETTANGLRVEVPDNLPGQHAWVFEISMTV